MEAFGFFGIVFSAMIIYFVVTMLIPILVIWLFSIDVELFFYLGWAVGFALFAIFFIAFITGSIS